MLFFFGTTIPQKKESPAAAAETSHTPKAIDVNQLLRHARERLTPDQERRVASMEAMVTRGDVKNQQLQSYLQLAAFWRDTIRLFEPYAYYTSEAAKLDNSEKSLTFAAHLFLTNLKTESDPAMQNWLATNARELFERSLEVNPKNDSSKIGLGACYIFGNISSNPMEGIAPIREIVQRDPENTFGQFILGLGGVKSGQYDKAIERFLIVIKKEPDNLEAALNLAEAYDQKGDKGEAVKWYQYVKTKIPNPDVQKELDARIKALK